MKIEVKDPSTGALMILDAKSENYRGEHGFRILHENGSGFFIHNRTGTWQADAGHHIDPEFLVNIGMALEGNKLSEQIVHLHHE